MTNTLTLTMPDELYHQLTQQAHHVAKPISEFVVSLLLPQLPPPIESDLPLALQRELKAMELLSDEVLWQIAQSCFNADKLAWYDLLLARYHAGELTPEGRAWLTQLREESESLTLRKAQAYLLLRYRGYKLPTLEELHAQTV